MTFVGDRALSRLRALVSEAPEDVVLGDRFELAAPLGWGGMGVVWVAWDRRDECEVAVKIVRPENERASARFEREAAAMANLSHPAVVRYIAHGTSPSGARYVAMEHLVGETLQSTLRRGPLSLEFAIVVAGRVAEALSAMHRVGIVHRDVKPSNVFLVSGAPNAVKLIDFGLARETEATAVTSAGALVGTPGYMAPEQVRSSGESFGPHVDVFGLGCLLFECLSGRAAFHAEGSDAVLAKTLLEEPPLVGELRPGVPPELESLVAQLLAKDVNRRPDVETAVRILTGLEVQSARGACPAIKVATKHRSRLSLDGGSGAKRLWWSVSVACAIIAVGVLSRPRHETTGSDGGPQAPFGANAEAGAEAEPAETGPVRAAASAPSVLPASPYEDNATPASTLPAEPRSAPGAAATPPAPPKSGSRPPVDRGAPARQVAGAIDVRDPALADR